MRPYIERSRCSSCGLCVKVCPCDVFVKDEGLVIVLAAETCIACLSCADECPNNAISLGAESP